LHSHTDTLKSISQGCIIGNSSLQAGVRLTLDASINATIRSVALLPGSYTLTTSNLNKLGNTSNTTLPLALFSPAQPVAEAGFASSGSLATKLSVALNNSQSPLFYPQPLYSGPVSVASGLGASLTARSVLMPSSAYAILQVDVLKGSPKQITVFDSIAATGQWSFQPSNDGGIKLLDFQSTTCEQPCASTGVCSSNGTCSCAAGFTGPTCSK
jgi:hypothetical protein